MDFQSQYLVAVTVTQLDQLESLRNQLSAMLGELNRSATLKVGLEIDDADLENKVRAAINRVTGSKGLSGTTPTAAAAQKPAQDQQKNVDFDELIREITRLTTAVTLNTNAQKAPKDRSSEPATATPPGFENLGFASPSVSPPPAGGTARRKATSAEALKRYKRALEAKAERIGSELQAINHDLEGIESSGDFEVDITDLKSSGIKKKFRGSAGADAVRKYLQERVARIEEFTKEHDRKWNEVLVGINNPANFRTNTAPGARPAGVRPLGAGAADYGAYGSEVDASFALFQKKFFAPMLRMVDQLGEAVARLSAQMAQMPAGGGGPAGAPTLNEAVKEAAVQAAELVGPTVGTYRKYAQSEALVAKLIVEGRANSSFSELAGVKKFQSEVRTATGERAAKEKRRVDAKEKAKADRDEEERARREAAFEAAKLNPRGFAARQQAAAEGLIYFEGGLGIRGAQRGGTQGAIIADQYARQAGINIRARRAELSEGLPKQKGFRPDRSVGDGDRDTNEYYETQRKVRAELAQRRDALLAELADSNAVLGGLSKNSPRDRKRRLSQFQIDLSADPDFQTIQNPEQRARAEEAMRVVYAHADEVQRDDLILRQRLRRNAIRGQLSQVNQAIEETKGPGGYADPADREYLAIERRILAARGQLSGKDVGGIKGTSAAGTTLEEEVKRSYKDFEKFRDRLVSLAQELQKFESEVAAADASGDEVAGLVARKKLAGTKGRLEGLTRDASYVAYEELRDEAGNPTGRYQPYRLHQRKKLETVEDIHRAAAQVEYLVRGTPRSEAEELQDELETFRATDFRPGSRQSLKEEYDYDLKRYPTDSDLDAREAALQERLIRASPSGIPPRERIFSLSKDPIPGLRARQASLATVDIASRKAELDYVTPDLLRSGDERAVKIVADAAARRLAEIDTQVGAVGPKEQGALRRRLELEAQRELEQLFNLPKYESNSTAGFPLTVDSGRVYSDSEVNDYLSGLESQGGTRNVTQRKLEQYNRSMSKSIEAMIRLTDPSKRETAVELELEKINAELSREGTYTRQQYVFDRSKEDPLNIDPLQQTVTGPAEVRRAAAIEDAERLRAAIANDDEKKKRAAQLRLQLNQQREKLSTAQAGLEKTSAVISTLDPQNKQAVELAKQEVERLQAKVGETQEQLVKVQKEVIGSPIARGALEAQLQQAESTVAALDPNNKDARANATQRVATLEAAKEKLEAERKGFALLRERAIVEKQIAEYDQQIADHRKIAGDPAEDASDRFRHREIAETLQGQRLARSNRLAGINQKLEPFLASRIDGGDLAAFGQGKSLVRSLGELADIAELLQDPTKLPSSRRRQAGEDGAISEGLATNYRTRQAFALQEQELLGAADPASIKAFSELEDLRNVAIARVGAERFLADLTATAEKPIPELGEGATEQERFARNRLLEEATAARALLPEARKDLARLQKQQAEEAKFGRGLSAAEQGILGNIARDAERPEKKQLLSSRYHNQVADIRKEEGQLALLRTNYPRLSGDEKKQADLQIAKLERSIAEATEKIVAAYVKRFGAAGSNFSIRTPEEHLARAKQIIERNGLLRGLLDPDTQNPIFSGNLTAQGLVSSLPKITGARDRIRSEVEISETLRGERARPDLAAEHIGSVDDFVGLFDLYHRLEKLQGNKAALKRYLKETSQSPQLTPNDLTFYADDPSDPDRTQRLTLDEMKDRIMSQIMSGLVDRRGVRGASAFNDNPSQTVGTRIPGASPDAPYSGFGSVTTARLDPVLGMHVPLLLRSSIPIKVPRPGSTEFDEVEDPKAPISALLQERVLTALGISMQKRGATLDPDLDAFVAAHRMGATERAGRKRPKKASNYVKDLLREGVAHEEILSSVQEFYPNTSFTSLESIQTYAKRLGLKEGDVQTTKTRGQGRKGRGREYTAEQMRKYLGDRVDQPTVDRLLQKKLVDGAALSEDEQAILSRASQRSDRLRKVSGVNSKHLDQVDFEQWLKATGPGDKITTKNLEAARKTMDAYRARGDEEGMKALAEKVRAARSAAWKAKDVTKDEREEVDRIYKKWVADNRTKSTQELNRKQGRGRRPKAVDLVSAELKKGTSVDDILALVQQQFPNSRYLTGGAAAVGATARRLGIVPTPATQAAGGPPPPPQRPRRWWHALGSYWYGNRQQVTGAPPGQFPPGGGGGGGGAGGGPPIYGGGGNLLGGNPPKPPRRNEDLFERFGRTLRNVSFYITAGGSAYFVLGQIGEAVRQAILLEQALARVQGVLRSKSATERNDIRQGVLGLASQYGVSPLDVVANVQTFAQAGYQGPRALEATRASLLAQVGAGLTPEQAQELLIAIDNISDGSIGLVEIIDRISRVESTRAVSAQDLALSLQRAGSLTKQLQPQQIGRIDFADLLIGLTTSVVEKTRITGNQASTGIKFILSRLTAPEIGNKLQRDFGIDLATSEGGTTLRPLIDILTDIGERYAELRDSGDTVRAAELLQAVAGARQINVAAAIFEDFSTSLDAAKESALALGDAEERAAINMDTLGTQLSRLRTNFFEFISNFTEQTGLFDGLETLLELLNDKLASGNASPYGASAGLAATGGLGALLGLGLYKGGIKLQTGAALRQGLDPATQLANATGRGAVAGRALSSVGGFAVTAGAIQLGLGVLGGIGTLYTWQRKARQAELDNFGVQRFDQGDFQSGEFFKAYKGLAERFTAGPDALYQSVGSGVAKAIELGLTGNLSARGPQAFALNRKLQNLQPGDYDRLTENLLTAFDQLVPGFSDITDEAERMRVAMELLTESMKFGSAAASQQAADLRSQTDTAVGKAKQELQQAAELTTEQADALFKGIRVSAAGVGGRGFVDETSRSEAVRGVGFGYSRRFAQAAEGAQDPDVLLKTAEKDIRDILLNNYGGILGVFAGIEDGALVKEIAKLTTESDVTLGRALDQVTERFQITEAQSAQIERVSKITSDQVYDRARLSGQATAPGPEQFAAALQNRILRSQALAGQPLEQLSPALRAEYDQRLVEARRDLARERPLGEFSADQIRERAQRNIQEEAGLRAPLENKRRIDSAFESYLNDRYDLQSRFRIARGEGQLARPDQAGGFSAAENTLSAFQRYLRETITRLQESGGDKNFLRYLEALENQDGRTSGRADITSRSRGRRVIRDYLLEALLGYGVQQTGSIRFAELGRVVGLGDTSAAERAQASQQALRKVAEVPALISAELIRLNDRISKSPGYQNYLELAGVEAEGRPERLVESFEEYQRIKSKVGLSDESTADLERQGQVLQQALAELESNDDLFSSLSQENKQRLRELLGQSAEELVFNYREIIGFFQDVAKADLERLTAQQQLSQIYELRGQLAVREVELQNQLAEQASSLVQRIADAQGPLDGLSQRAVGIRERADRERSLAATRRDAAIRAAESQVELGGVEIGNRRFAARQQYTQEIAVATATESMALQMAELEYRSNRVAESFGEISQTVEQGTSGFRDLVSNFPNLRDRIREQGAGNAIVGGILTPAADAIQSSLGQGIQQSLFGPEGIFRQASETLFGVPERLRYINLEKEAIISAHQTGITAAFAQALATYEAQITALRSGVTLTSPTGTAAIDTAVGTRALRSGTKSLGVPTVTTALGATALISGALNAEDVYAATGSKTAYERWPAIVAALQAEGIDSPNMRRAVAATIGVETGGAFRANIRELSPKGVDRDTHFGNKYGHRKDLGNRGFEDGAKYYGRGEIQLTGRSNYVAYGEALGLDLENNPDLALDPTNSARILARYFRLRGDKNGTLTEAAQAGDFRRVRALVNGGYNGYDEYQKYLDKFGVTTAPSAQTVLNDDNDPYGLMRSQQYYQTSYLPPAPDLSSVSIGDIAPVDVGSLYPAAGNPWQVPPKSDLDRAREELSIAQLAAEEIGGTPGKGSWAQLRDQALMLAGTYGGAALGEAVGRGPNSYANEGATLGATLGSLTPLGPVGGLLGGLVGGLLGGQFGKKEDDSQKQLESLELIERNTRESVQAIENQTQLLTLEDRFLNAPSTFAVPDYRPLTVGGGAGTGEFAQQVNVNVTINEANNPQAVAQAVSRALQDALRRQGTFTNTRY